MDLTKKPIATGFPRENSIALGRVAATSRVTTAAPRNNSRVARIYFWAVTNFAVNYPRFQSLVSIKPELPAKNLISLLTPLDNLLLEWNYEQIGKPWQQVPYDPQIHQPDVSYIAVGELVYIRFVGYRCQECILCAANLSRTLPGGVRGDGETRGIDEYGCDWFWYE